MQVMSRYPLLYKCQKEDNLLGENITHKMTAVLPPAMRQKPKAERPRYGTYCIKKIKDISFVPLFAILLQPNYFRYVNISLHVSK